MTPDKSSHPAASAGGFPQLLLRLWAPVAGTLVVITGVVLLAQGPGSGAVDFGWVAYTPVPETGLPGGVVFYSRSMQIGAVLVLAGSLLIAFWGGYQAGLRRRGKPA